MTAISDEATSTGAVVRKPPGTTLWGGGYCIRRRRNSQLSWVVAGIVPGIERAPLKKLAVDEGSLLKLLSRWRQEAEKAVMVSGWRAGCGSHGVAGSGRARSRGPRSLRSCPLWRSLVSFETGPRDFYVLAARP